MGSRGGERDGAGASSKRIDDCTATDRGARREFLCEPGGGVAALKRLDRPGFHDGAGAQGDDGKSRVRRAAGSRCITKTKET